MRYMTMLVFWIVAIDKPLLQLPISTYLHWWQLCYGIAEHCCINNIIISQYLMSFQSTRQHIENYLVVHCRTSSYSSFLSYRTMFRRHSWYCNKPSGSMLNLSILRILLHIRQQEISSTLQYRIALLQEILVTCIQIVLPQMSGKPCATSWEHAP